MKPKNHIHIKVDPAFKELLNSSQLKSTANKILDELNITASEISLNFVDNTSMQQMNFRFRGLNDVTDVLSFSTNEMNPENGFKILGDIVISIPVALSQAEERQHTLTQEVHLLMIHGILHLIGYDHQDAKDKKRMLLLQRQLESRVN